MATSKLMQLINITMFVAQMSLLHVILMELRCPALTV